MSKPKLLLTRRWPREVEHYLSQRYEVTLNEPDTPLDPSALRAALASYDAICPTVTDKLNAEVLQAAAGGRLKVLGNYGVGVSHIDLEACRRLGVVVTNTPDVLTDATAEIAIALMLMVARRAGEGERQVREHRWEGWAPTRMIGAAVTGKTLGLVGFGRIGQATARKARHGFGMRVLYYSRKRAPADIESATGGEHCGLEDLLESADFVSLHCPGGAETRHLLNAARLGHMKPSAFLINTARGEVVDEAALAVALRTGALAGAGLDVYEHEPRVPEAFLGLENVVLLPHLGSATLETRVAMGMRVAENLDRFFAGLEPGDRVI
jgi:lactate dehydrogenase-like 2-hydroxyacid dehydrogenase